MPPLIVSISFGLELEVQAYANYVVLTSVVASSTVLVCELVIVVERVQVTKVELQLF